MKALLRVLLQGIMLAVLVACGGYDDDGAVETPVTTPASSNASSAGTSLFLALDVGTAPRSKQGQAKAPVAGLIRSNFDAVAMVPDRSAPDGLRQVPVDIFDFEDRGNGVYRVAIDGKPRINVVIFVTVNNTRLKYLVLDPGSESKPAVIDVASSAATEVFLDAVAEQGDFGDLSLEEVLEIIEDTVDTIEALPPPPAGLTDAEIIEYYSGEVVDECALDIVTGASNCPQTVRVVATGLNSPMQVRLSPGQQNLTLTGSGEFEFEGQLALGTEFSVAIQSQPAGQRCVLQNASGLVASGQPDVAVTCESTYSIGGAVSGLSGVLKLALNGEVDIIDRNESGSFPNRLFPGTAYTITVIEQPEGQTCQFPGQLASGIMPAADITNFNIVCFNNPYQISGSLSGLVGTLTLSLNGRTPVQFTTGANSFSFEGGVPFGSPFEVAVINAPPGQLCTPLMQTGTVPARNVTDLVIQCVDRQFPVGGFVSGLESGGSLTLSLNDASNDVVISEDGVYQFPVGLPVGQDYAVSVVDEPTGYTCVVDPIAARGVMPAQALSDVDVECMPNEHSVRGIVQGLQGQLTLALNGAGQVITVNGEFTFDDVLAYGDEFSVTVQSQPVGQICTVLPDGIAVMGDEDVTAVLVTCANDAYAVGGVVSGMPPCDASTDDTCDLVLSLNNDQTIQRLSDGDFDFPQNIEYRASYSVQIVDEPLGLDCELLGGSGVMGAGPVEDIRVECVPAQRLVTGNILGLQGVITLGLNGGADALDASGDGPFQFDVPVPIGSSYQVSIIHQPVGQQCSVSPATPLVMPAASAASVTVTCVPEPYSLGGQVDGLLPCDVSGDSACDLSLTVNGDESIDIKFSGSFQFPTTREFATSYSVVVSQQPVGQQCLVTGGSGVMPPADVDTIQVTCRSLDEVFRGVWRSESASDVRILGVGEGQFLLGIADTLADAQETSDAESGGFEFDTQTGALSVFPGVGFDTNPEQGFIGRSAPINVAFDNDVMTITVATEPPQSRQWVRVQEDPQGIRGSWRVGSDAELRALASFIDEQRYFVISTNADANFSPCAVPGVEYGRYAYDASADVLSFFDVTIDTDGCNGVHDASDDSYASFTDARFVNLDNDENTLDAFRGIFTDGDILNYDIIYRVGFHGEDISSVGPALQGVWDLTGGSSPVDRTTTREVLRFEYQGSALNYVGGRVSASGPSGSEKGFLFYSNRTTAITSEGLLDNDGVAGLINTPPNMTAILVEGAGVAAAVPPTQERHHLRIADDGRLYIYDFVTDATRQFSRAPQRDEEGTLSPLLGAWVTDNDAFFRSMVVFYPDNRYLLIDVDSNPQAACQTAGVEYAPFIYDAAASALTVAEAIQDTNGCGGLRNPQGPSDPATFSPVQVVPGETLEEDTLTVIETTKPLFRIPNDGTVALEQPVGYSVGGTAILAGQQAVLELTQIGGGLGVAEAILTGGAFTFDSTVPDGVYGIGFVDIPFGQSCQVSRSGAASQPISTIAVDGQDINDLQATCSTTSPDTAFVTGAVTGIEGNFEVVLNENQAAEQRMWFNPQSTSDVSQFSFAVASGTSYSLAFSQQPADYACSFGAGSAGTAGGQVSVNAQCQLAQIGIASVRPVVPTRGDVVTVSGYGFDTLAESSPVSVGPYIGSVIGTPTRYELKFVMPSVDPGPNRLSIQSNTGERADRIINVVDALSVNTGSAFPTVAAGGRHTCAVAGVDKRVYCWGDNGSQQSGDPQAGLVNLPREVNGLLSIESVVAGAMHSCALVSNGSVYCWGSNAFGQLGSETPGIVDSANPVFVAGLSGVSALSAGEHHTCAVTAGAVRCWGDNRHGQIRPSTRETSGTPTVSYPTPHTVYTGALGTPLRLGLGHKHSCLLISSGQVICWGDNLQGQLGHQAQPYLDPDASEANTLVATDTVSVLDAGAFHTCVIANPNGSGDGAYCWGSNDQGQLGVALAEAASSTSPYPINLPEVPQRLSAGVNSTCAISFNGRVHCWGSNDAGQLGDGKISKAADTPSTAPPVATVLDIVNASGSISVGGMEGSAHACVTTANNRLRCWGADWAAQLGDGEQFDQPLGAGLLARREPVVQTGSVASKVAVGGKQESFMLNTAHACTVTDQARVECAGAARQLGVINQEGRSFLEPAFENDASMILPLSGILDVVAGDAHSCALDVSGTLKCWGRGVFGAFGSLASVQQAVAVPMIGMSGLTDISAGRGHTCGVHAGGVKCVGLNSAGQLGVAQEATPPQGQGLIASDQAQTVSGLSNVSVVEAGNEHTCALDAAGAGIQCWGGNARGQLGTGNLESTHIPQSVTIRHSAEAPPSTLDEAFGLAVGADHACARLPGGAVACWGDNQHGQLGVGYSGAGLADPVQSSEALIVPGVSDVQILAAGERNTCAVNAVGRVFCWGEGSIARRGVPHMVTGLSDVIDLSVGATSACALVAPDPASLQGTVMCWGNNDGDESGGIRKPSTVRLSVPLDVVIDEGDPEA